MTIDPRMASAFEQTNGFSLWDHCLVIGMMGSHSHGTYVPPVNPDAIDDVDLMGVCVPPPDRTLGTQGWEGWNWKHDELDVVFYSLQKAVRLMLKANPNILGLLWLRHQDYVYRHADFSRLTDNRAAFSSLHAYHAFTGYAHGQLTRMTHFDTSRMDEYRRLSASVEAAGYDPRVLLEMNGPDFDSKTRTYPVAVTRDAHQLRSLHRKYFSGYMGEKRKGLVERHGYDCKNAAHLIRLMRMCVEFLRDGRLRVYRTEDADTIRAIKSGEWTLDAVKEEAERLFAAAREERDRCPLPEEPDHDRATAICVGLHLKWYAEVRQHAAR